MDTLYTRTYSPAIRRSDGLILSKSNFNKFCKYNTGVLLWIDTTEDHFTPTNIIVYFIPILSFFLSFFSAVLFIFPHVYKSMGKHYKMHFIKKTNLTGESSSTKSCFFYFCFSNCNLFLNRCICWLNNLVLNQANLYVPLIIYTICPRSLDKFYSVSYKVGQDFLYIQRVLLLFFS